MRCWVEGVFLAARAYRGTRGDERCEWFLNLDGPDGLQRVDAPAAEWPGEDPVAGERVRLRVDARVFSGTLRLYLARQAGSEQAAGEAREIHSNTAPASVPF